MELRKIANFQVYHTKLERGMYISRIDRDVVTYDIRLKKPNSEPVLSKAATCTSTTLRRHKWKPRHSPPF